MSAAGPPPRKTEGFGLGFLVMAFVMGLVGGVAVGLAATVLVWGPAMERSAERTALGEGVKILAMKEDVPAFATIEREHLTIIEWPRDYLPPRFLPHVLVDDVIGQETAYAVRKGTPLQTTDLAATPSGQRAGSSPPAQPDDGQEQAE